MQEQQRMPLAIPADVELAARFFSGLADPTRLSIVELLLERPHTVGEIVARLGLRQSRVSNALVCLKWCGYVEARREGRYAWAPSPIRACAICDLGTHDHSRPRRRDRLLRAPGQRGQPLRREWTPGSERRDSAGRQGACPTRHHERGDDAKTRETADAAADGGRRRCGGAISGRAGERRVGGAGGSGLPPALLGSLLLIGLTSTGLGHALHGAPWPLIAGAVLVVVALGALGLRARRARDCCAPVPTH